MSAPKQPKPPAKPRAAAAKPVAAKVLAPKTSRKANATAVASSPSGAPTAPLEYTIDALAREAGTTVRNVRAYQDRGLLHPPELRGRTGVYGDVHLMRLRLIGHLLSRGYTLGNINELLGVIEDGQSLHDILGLQRAIASPWSDEVPRHFSLPELLKMFGMVFNPRVLAKVIALGLLEPDGLRYRAPRPRMLIAGAELHKAGLKIEETLELVTQLRANVQHVADAMVQQVVANLDRYNGRLPPKEEIPKLANLVWRLRPLAMMAVESEVSRALELAANKFLGERVEQLLDSYNLDQPV